ncbi:inhibin beta chain isoform X3 [Drosophila mauritiana]|uniref:Inhibin beta chain isoform X3 n=1 Tax=Drosophila mauritiana TaxID=7226 RepID=A0A6P8KYF9_DROMA|nr:inhibin beta chain isoform X3 [Drosophila mauritiana]
MRFAFDSNHSQSEASFKGSRCFFNCQCICCRQGCCVVVVKCCCCFNLNCCNSLGSRKSFPQSAAMRKKVSDLEVLRVSRFVAVILVLARWVTAVATLLTSCILLDIFSVPGQSGVADRSQASSRTVHVSVPTTPNETPSSNSETKLKLLYGYTSYDINNDQQVKSNNLYRVLCRSRNRKRQRRRRRRNRRRRRHRYTKRLHHVMQSNMSGFEQRLSFSDGKCQSLETNYGTNYALVHGRKLFSQSERSLLVYPLREIEAPWPAIHGSMRNCSKIKRNRANLIWLLIGLVWFEVKLINCNGISSSNYYATNLESHKGCTLCHESGKPNIYTDKDNPHTDYNIYNKYHSNNNFNKKTNQPHNNIAPSDEVRLESIKRQILTKLGLSHKPNVSNPLPKQFIWETIYRADGGRMIPNNAFGSNELKSHHTKKLKSGAVRKVNGFNGKQMNENALKKSTYLIDINHSIDNKTHSGINGEIRPNAYEYFNDYSVQTHYKNRYHAGRSSIGYQPAIHSIEDENKKGHHESFAHDQENIDHEDFFGNTQEIITFAEEGTQYRQYRILEFSAQNRRVPSQKLSIRSAQIHIRIDKPHSFWIERAKSLPEKHLLNTKRKWGANKQHHRIKIWVFQLSTSINITEKGIDKAIIFRASFEVDTKNLGWQKFDLTDTIREWYGHTSHEKLRLLIDCTGCGGRYSLHLFQTSKLGGNSSDYLSTNPNRPFLVLHTESSRTRRVRRRAVDCGGALNGQCCKESFYVSFKALGWDDWIIAPRGYFANYCRGDCTGTFRTPDTFQTFHAHFIEEYRKMGLLNGMRPCCAPIKFSSMSLIYYGDDGIIKRDLPKMVVDECGCP